MREWIGGEPYAMNVKMDRSASFGVFGLRPSKYTLRPSERDRPRLAIRWWRYGTKEKNLVPADAKGVETSLNTSEKPTPLVINATDTMSVDFEVVSGLQGASHSERIAAGWDFSPWQFGKLNLI